MKKSFTKYFQLLMAVAVTAFLIQSCKKDNSSMMPAASQEGLSPDSAQGGATLTLKGTGLANMRTIMFSADSVPAPFNPVFNTDNALIFRVPDTAFGGPQNVIFTNADGRTLIVPFNVLAYPSVSAISNYDFNADDEITLTGNNLENVSSVVLTTDKTPVTIVSQSHHTLVVKMPSTNLTRSFLNITNASATITTSQEFVNIALAYPIFLDDYAANISNGSWGPAAISTTVAKTGTASFAATYQKGNWSADGFANWFPGVSNLQTDGYTYLTFWVKGGSQDYSLYLTCSTRTAGYGNNDVSTPVNVPANVWTYFKFPLSTIGLWATGNSFAQLGWWIKGPDAQDETFYFDDVMFVK